jgi:hypothetical protein
LCFHGGGYAGEIQSIDSVLGVIFFNQG